MLPEVPVSVATQGEIQEKCDTGRMIITSHGTGPFPTLMGLAPLILKDKSRDWASQSSPFCAPGRYPTLEV